MCYRLTGVSGVLQGDSVSGVLQGDSCVWCVTV